MAKTDKQILLEIMAGAFHESDRLKAILRKGKTDKRIKLMSAYAYDLAVKFNGVFLSNDKTTAIVYWKDSDYNKSFRDHMKYFIMFLRTIQIRKVFETLKREKAVENRRPKLDDYIYVWLLGSDPSTTSIKGLVDIRNHLFTLSEENKIPILMETTVEKLLKLYRYVGFEVYDSFFDETIAHEVYFMRKDYKKCQ